MMDHPSAHTLQDFVDGVLSRQDQQVVRSHIVGCGDCSRIVSELGLARQSLRSLPGLTLPRTFGSDIAASVRDRAKAELEWSLIERTAERLLAGIAIVVLLLLAASETVLRPDETDDGRTAGLLDVFIRDTTTVRLLSSEDLTRDDVLAAALTSAEESNQ